MMRAFFVCCASTGGQEALTACTVYYFEAIAAIIPISETPTAPISWQDIVQIIWKNLMVQKTITERDSSSAVSRITKSLPVTQPWSGKSLITNTHTLPAHMRPVTFGTQSFWKWFQCKWTCFLCQSEKNNILESWLAFAIFLLKTKVKGQRPWILFPCDMSTHPHSLNLLAV